MNKKVSIIIPVYNAEVFLKKTVNSILDQTYRDLEIILVNDCSKDKSLSIINRFAEEDDRIVVVDKTRNEGVDSARFSGIEIATGDYLTFLDADDWLMRNAIELMVGIAVSKHVDIVYANNWRVFSAKLGIKRLGILNNEYCNRVITGKEKDDLFISFFGINMIPVTLWGALFKKGLFNKDLEKTGLKFGEDLALGMQLYHNAASFYLYGNPLIFYRWGGVTAKFQPHFLPSSKKLFRKKMEFADKLNFDRARRTATIELVNCLSSHVFQLAEYYPGQPEENIKALQEEMKDPVYSCFKTVQDNRYFVDGALNTLCMRLDARNAYELAAKAASTPKAKLRHYMKKWASFLLRYIRL